MTLRISAGGCVRPLTQVFQRERNSVYDPDYSWGGDQCYGHVSMTDRFERYYVKKSKFTLLGGDYEVDTSVAQVYAYIWADTTDTFGGGNNLNTIHGMCTANGGRFLRFPIRN